MKKGIAFILAAAMLLSFGTICVSASDTPSDWAAEEVRLAEKEGIITDAVTRDYQKDVTREEFCELIIKLYEKLTGTKAKAGADVFTDTDNEEVIKAYHLGIVKGVSDNAFAPEKNITRQEICVMVVRCIDVAVESADIRRFDSHDFADRDKIADWAIDFVNYAYEHEIMKGVGNSRIDPLGNATCEQSILLAYRIYLAYGRTDAAYRAEMENIATDPETGVSYVNNIIVIFFRNGTTQEEKNAVVSAINGEVAGRFDTVDQYQVRVKASTFDELNRLCDTVNGFDCVLAATIDLAMEVSTDAIVVPDDKWQNDDWSETRPGGNNWWLEAIQAPSAWNYNDRLESIKIGVVDNGFDTGHEDLKNKLSFPSEAVQAVNSSEEHGTHVAGIIGAEANNQKGITGIVWKADLICFDWEPSAFQSFLGGWTTSTAVYDGLIETVNAGAKVVNFSLGCSSSLNDNNSTLSQAWIDRQGQTASLYMAALLMQGYDFIVVQSAGNGAKDQIGVDAIYNGFWASVTRNNCISGVTAVDNILDRIIIVGAAEQDSGGYRQTRFSNGGTQVDICAPGVDVYSTVPGMFSGSYKKLAGTSMAAPIVAGVAALVWSADPKLTGAQVRSIVCDPNNSAHTAADHAGSANAVGAFGLVNAKLSVEKALGIERNKELGQLVGTYKGSYMANQGETGLTLTVYEENGAYKATFDFYNLPGRNNAKDGKYYMDVTFDGDKDEYVFSATEWIEQPPNYYLLDLRGKLEDGVLSGNDPTQFRVTTLDRYVSPGEKLKNLVGTYQGSYFPGQGETGLTLTIYEEAGQYKAIFDFYSLPGRSNSKSGSYYMNVSYNELADTYSFTGYEWIEQPSNYVFADLTGACADGVLSGSRPYQFTVTRTE